MERRDALRILGGSLAVLSGCAGRGVIPDTGGGGTTTLAGASERQFSRFESVEPDAVSLQIARDDVPEAWRSSVHVAVFTRTYPRGSVVESGRSETIEGLADPFHSVTLQLDADGTAASEPLHRVAEIRPGAPPDDHPTPGTGSIVAETDRFLLESGSLRPDPHPETVESTTEAGFSREEMEGAYIIRISEDSGEWTLPLRVFKSEFVMGRNGWRGHDYPPYVDHARASGLARYLSREISRVAEARSRDPIPFAVEVVQTLPYVPESVTESADEYIKYPAETLVDGGGDCEDSAILLASLLEEAPIDRDCALIHPPHHMGLGIAGEYSGTYYPYEGERYFYVETTGSGWEIGELPAEYADTSALVFQV